MWLTPKSLRKVILKKNNFLNNDWHHSKKSKHYGYNITHYSLNYLCQKVLPLNFHRNALMLHYTPKNETSRCKLKWLAQQINLPLVILNTFYFTLSKLKSCKP